jgi:hypothetical protein
VLAINICHGEAEFLGSVVLIVSNQHSVQSGSQPRRRSPGDLSARRQLPRDELGQLTRLYETLTKSSPLLVRTGPAVRRRTLLRSTGAHRSPRITKRPAQSHEVGLARQAMKYVALVLVGAASFLVGLNFERFADYGAQVPDLYQLAIYHLSGQAEADKRAYEEQARVQEERIRQEQEMELQRAKHEQEIEAQHAKEEQVRLARIEQIRTTTAAWQDFLADNRGKFKQIELITDQHHSDYNCLRIRNTLWDFVSANGRRAELARQKAEASTYQIRDAISYEFVEWLNADHVFERTDWKYADLRHIETEFSAGCLSPDQVWRANRHYEPNDIVSLMMSESM